MSSEFNPYESWLGLPPDARPRDYYELLGLERGEASRATIAAAGERTLSRVRSCRPGPHAKQWAQLLDEISTAKDTLLDPTRRQEYDRSLARAETSVAAPVTTSTAAGPIAAAWPPGREGVSPTHGAAAAFASPATGGLGPPTGLAPPVAPGAAAIIDPMAPVTAPMPAAGAYPMTPMSPNPMAPMMPNSLAMAPYGVQPDPSLMPQSPYPGASMPTYPGFPAPGYGNPMAGYAPPAGTPVMPPAYGPASFPMPGGMPPPSGNPAMMPVAGAGYAPMTPAAQPAASAAPGAPVFGVKGPKSAAAIAARRAKNSWMAPLLVGGGLGVCLLIAVYYVSTSLQADSSVAWDAGPAPVLPAPPTDAEMMAEPAPDEPQMDGELNAPAIAPEMTEPNSFAAPAPGAMPELPPLNLSGALNAGDSTPPGTPPAPNGTPSPTPTPSTAGAVPSTTPGSPTPTTTPAPNQTPEELQRLSKLFTDAREAFLKHEPQRAQELLKEAEPLAKSADQQEKYDRLVLLVDLAGKYREAVDQALSKLQGGDEIEVGSSTIVAVVESAPDRLVIRAGGGNRRYTRAEIPLGLVVALATRELPPEAALNAVMKGAYVLCDPKAKDADQEKARGWWKEHSASVPEAASLLKALEDDYAFAP